MGARAAQGQPLIAFFCFLPIVWRALRVAFRFSTVSRIFSTPILMAFAGRRRSRGAWGCPRRRWRRERFFTRPELLEFPRHLLLADGRAPGGRRGVLALQGIEVSLVARHGRLDGLQCRRVVRRCRSSWRCFLSPATMLSSRLVFVDLAWRGMTSLSSIIDDRALLLRGNAFPRGREPFLTLTGRSLPRAGAPLLEGTRSLDEENRPSRAQERFSLEGTRSLAERTVARRSPVCPSRTHDRLRLEGRVPSRREPPLAHAGAPRLEGTRSLGGEPPLARAGVSLARAGAPLPRGERVPHARDPPARRRGGSGPRATRLLRRGNRFPREGASTCSPSPSAPGPPCSGCTASSRGAPRGA